MLWATLMALVPIEPVEPSRITRRFLIGPRI
jgi:hypothetical protein